ncbi:hypothetical protein Isop_2121 [Isosphaera pallida ATCC 43644]|uniref:Uncharacterized protein n=1 Tax=Isosphaera pallida (strain ATCC 43644 / DSM 9630 / IS1B) TaxID=575540 RepID=E8R4A0_ISOPI|nr:hypothetical protein [Isosphaera pallida]ADV62701.1 hypothetical protein Isop_2121 [Isosphaera pallida ATCC 43644]
MVPSAPDSVAPVDHSHPLVDPTDSRLDPTTWTHDWSHPGPRRLTLLERLFTLIEQDRVKPSELVSAINALTRIDEYRLRKRGWSRRGNSGRPTQHDGFEAERDPNRPIAQVALEILADQARDG